MRAGEWEGSEGHMRERGEREWGRGGREKKKGDNAGAI